MNIHEYQGKEVLKSFGVPVLEGYAALTVEEAVAAAQKLTTSVVVVKSQIHAGGRGAGRFTHAPDGKGGVRVVKGVDEVRLAAEDMLGKVLVTKQTGPKGKQVQRLYIESGCLIDQEFYLAILLDRATSQPMLVCSKEGGMDIEEVAHDHPEKILSLAIDPAYGIKDFHVLEVAAAYGLTGNSIKSLAMVLKGLYKAFIAKDAAMIEINPLVLTKDGAVIALDAKVSFDSNALYRQADIVAYRDLSEEDPAEVEASKYDLNYVKLDGNIGCMVNGAGLAMATMDIIKFYGAEPANFLDVGGGATTEKVTAALKIILSDTNVKGILVNIFGGIMRCDIIANGVVAAAKEVGVQVPLVVRLEGTNVDLGKEILKNSGINVVSADNLDDAAQKIVTLVKG